MANEYPVPSSNAETTAIATANGQTAFSFDWRADASDQVHAIYRPVGSPERVLELGVDFSVQGLQNPAGGSILLVGFSANKDDVIYMFRETLIEREKKWQNEGDYKADLVNKEQDDIYMIMQENRRDMRTNAGGLNAEIAARIAGDEALSGRIDGMEGVVNDAAQRAENAADASEVSAGGASESADRAEAAAASVDGVFSLASKSVLEALNVKPEVNAIHLDGWDALGDGLGGLFIDQDNGSTDTILSADGRAWYRVKDVGLDRLQVDVLPNDGVAFFKDRYKKRVMANIPSSPPTYQQVLAIETDSTFFIAQGMCLDRVDDKLYIIMSSPGTGKNMWVFVYEWGTFSYITTFGLKLTGVTGGEGVEVIWEGSKRFVYARTISNGVERFDITSLPPEMTILTADSTYINGAGGQISYRYGQWLVRQWVGSSGGSVRNDQFHLLESDLLTVRSVKTFKPLDVGLAAGSLSEKFVPKIQGMTLGDGIMFAPMGGAAGISGDQNGYGYCGIRVFNTQAECISDNLVSPSAFAQKLISNGYFCTRMEYEGGFQDIDGKIYTLAVVVSPSHASAVDGGMLIIEEFSTSPDAIDFRDCAQSLRIPSADRLSSGVFPVSTGGVMLNPMDGSILDTWDKMLDLMQGIGLPRMAYFSSKVAGTKDFSGSDVPSSAFVEIISTNDDTFIVTVTINGVHYIVRAYGASGSRSYNTYASRMGGQGAVTTAQAQAGHTWFPSHGDHIQVGGALNTEGSLTLMANGAVRGTTVEIKRGKGTANLLVKNTAGVVIQTLTANQIGKVMMGGADWYSWSVINQS